jgi:hypothetical protein
MTVSLEVGPRVPDARLEGITLQALRKKHFNLDAF